MADETKTYKVLESCELDGNTYSAGQEVQLTTAQAEALAGKVEEVVA